MGCDIHWVLEQKFDDKWIGVFATNVTPVPAGTIAEKSTHGDGKENFEFSPYKHYYWSTLNSRSYKTFAKLAGVRGDGPKPIGVPDNASELTKKLVDDWGHDGHSHTHMSAKDFIVAWLSDDEIQLTVKDRFTSKQGFRFSYLLGLEDRLIDNYRVVCWFDN